jgi:5-methylcytosine-specific restriction enzyme A
MGHGSGSVADTGSMSAFILTWHPEFFRWEEYGYREAIQSTADGQLVHDDWTVGNRKGGISPGDRAYLYRQHDCRGIVASGIFTSGVEIREHWDGSERSASFADLRWDTVLDYEDRLPLEVLTTEVPEMPWNHLQGSGIQLKATAIPALQDLWQSHASAIFWSADEPRADEPRSDDEPTFPEGALTQVEVNRYERDPRARNACLQHWGCRCAVCDFSFEEIYGSLGRDYIHVHHLREL